MKLNDQKITKDFCLDKRLLFFPKTKEEAILIQEKPFNDRIEAPPKPAKLDKPRLKNPGEES